MSLLIYIKRVKSTLLPSQDFQVLPAGTASVPCSNSVSSPYFNSGPRCLVFFHLPHYFSVIFVIEDNNENNIWIGMWGCNSCIMRGYPRGLIIAEEFYAPGVIRKIQSLFLRLKTKGFQCPLIFLDFSMHSDLILCVLFLFFLIFSF